MFDEKLIYSFGLAIIIGILSLIFWKRKHKDNIPEPFGWPLFGHFFLFNNSPGKTFVKIAEKYGNVFKINLGRRPYLVLNGYTANKETFSDMPLIFAGRPDTFSMKLLYQEGIDFCGPWNEKFKQSRKASVRALAATSTIRNDYFEQLLEEACAKFIESLTLNYKETFIDPEKDLIQLLGHIISGILFGKLSPNAYDDEYYEILFKLNRFETQFNNTALIDCFPILEIFFRNYNFKMLKSAKSFKSFLLKQIEKHQKSDIENVPNVLDILLDFHKKENNAMYENDVAGHLIFLLEGGVETVPTACLWFFLLLANNPDIQERLYNHIKEVVGNRPIQWNDKSKLPFLDACILEMHRYASLGPIGFFHATTEETTYNGFHIPKGMGVIGNIWSVHNDKAMWENPEVFNPERFLKEGGKEINSGLAGKIYSFSMGRRRCIGENITNIVMFVFLGRIMQMFKIEADQEIAESLKTLANAGIARPLQFKIKAKLR